jgi:hypothetical protein
VTAATVSETRRELARRASGGLDVTLYWNAFDNSTSVEVRQRRSGEALAFVVAGRHALEAFYHPFAHLPTAFSDLPDAQGGNW